MTIVGRIAAEQANLQHVSSPIPSELRFSLVLALSIGLACARGPTAGGSTDTGSETGASSTPGSEGLATEASSSHDATSASGPSSSEGSSGRGATDGGSSSESGSLPECTMGGRFSQERFTDGDIELIDDVAYSVEGTTLDLYLPDAALEPCPTRPVLLMVHGGAWVVGQKEWLDARARFHARRGLVVATIDYRMTTSEALCSGDGWNRAGYRAMQDIHAAAQRIAADAPLYAIDPDAVFLYGNSAGAITTLSLALTDADALGAALPDLVASEGQLDTVTLHPRVEYGIAAMYTQAGALLDDALLAANAERPALLLLHSEGDASVPYEIGPSAVCMGTPLTLYGSSWIRDAIADAGQCTALVQVDGAIHDLDEVYGERCDAVDPPCAPSRLDDTAARFFSAVVGDGCDAQHSFCTTTDCELVEGAPSEWFTLFP